MIQKKCFEKNNQFGKYSIVKSNLVVGSNDKIVPEVSIIMPIYNHPDYFEKALKSAIDQDYMGLYDIIVVDNNHPIYQAKNQEIVENCKSEKVKYYLNESNIGGAGNANRGVELSSATYVTFCHDDDLLEPDCLSSLIEAKNKISGDCLIVGHHVRIDKDGNILNKHSYKKSKELKKISLWNYLLGNNSNGGGSLYNRSTFIEIGGYIEEYIPCPDYYLNSAYTYLKKTYYLHKTTLRYRISDQSDSKLCYIDIPIAHDKVYRDIVNSGRVNRIIAGYVHYFSNKAMVYYNKNIWSNKKNIRDMLAGMLYNFVNRFNALIIKYIK